MQESRFYIKKLTSAEAESGTNNVHEIYIRLTNNFDYVSFFQNKGVVKEDNSCQIDFTVTDITFVNDIRKYDLRFVAYNSAKNKERRIPSLKSIFTSRGVKAGDIVCLESRTINDQTKFYISFNKTNNFPLSGDSMFFSVKNGCESQIELYKTLSIENRTNAFKYYLENIDKKVDIDNIQKYCQTYIPHINKYVSQLSGFKTLYDICTIEDHIKVAKIALKDKNPDPNYTSTYQSSFNKYRGFIEELCSTNSRINLYDFGAKRSNVNKDIRTLPLQQIYYGAPGTGKSHTINRQTEGENVIRTTFHPDSDYSTFVGAYKPTMGLLPICDELGQPMKIGSTILHKEQIIYEFVDQAFLQAYVKAWKFYAENCNETKKQFLIIEEINRGNCAQIFGDLFQLLDRNDNGFSVYPINADKDMKKHLAKAFKNNGKTITIEGADKINAFYKGKDVVSQVLSGDILILPDNLYIWATMNTSDQSLFPIDSAFKRRWEWQYMPIGKGYNKDGTEIKWYIEGLTKKYSWWSFLEKINAQIAEATQSEDKKLGFFFCKANGNEISAEKFVGKVIFYLWNDVFKNNGFEGTIFKDADGSELSFGKFYKSDMKGNAIVQKEKVELFLNNLGVDALSEESDDSNIDSEFDEDETEDSNDKLKLTIKFPDGEIIAGNTKFESYLAALKKIGLDKAEQVASEKKYHRLGCALISTVEEQAILEATSYSYIQDQGYYIVKGMNAKTMRNMLGLLSQKYGLQLEVVYE